MNRTKNAVVVGASAVGCITAKELARQGLEVDVLEDNPLVGKYGKCGGIMSKEGMDESRVKYEDLVLNEIKGSYIFGPGKANFQVRRSQAQAVVMSRQAFDERCADEATAAGARIHVNEPATKFENNGVITAHSKTLKLESNLLVGCDGVGSFTAKEFGFPQLPQDDIVLSYQAEFENANVPERDMVDLFLAADYKGFFAWTIPVNEERIRIGLGTTDRKNIRSAEKTLFEKTPRIVEILKGSKKVFEFYHAIPLKYRQKTQLDLPSGNHVALCGDSAGQVKATTGGGVVFAAKCAQELAKQAKTFSEGGEFNYETAWKKRVKKALDRHYFFHRTFQTMGNRAFELGVGVAGALGMGKFLEAFGDMDYVVR